MPVVTRSCGREGVRRRIEDPTPRRPCQTTVKRKKENSDEESEKPAKKKANILTVRLENIGVTPLNHQTKASRIPRRCTTIKMPMKENCKPSNNNVHDTPVVEQTQASSPTTGTPEHMTPVAARTRSFSALKRSYKAKKTQRNQNKTIAHHTSSSEEEEGTNGVNNGTQETTKVNKAVEDVVSSTCDSANNDVEMREEQENQDEVTNEKQTLNDDFYKAKFHELLQQVKGIQESFDNAQANASTNIQAYDAFIKELKDNLEQEKAKVTSTAQELQTAKEQLEDAQKELEQARKQSSVNNEPESSNSAHQKVNNLHSMTKFYEMLSGISLSEETDSVQSFESYLCVYKPKGFKGKAMQFRLTYDKEIEEVEFSPVIQSPSSGEFLQRMPRYLRENIYFSTDQAPGFLLRLIQSYQKQH